jgi:hypothetical protein
MSETSGAGSRGRIFEGRVLFHNNCQVSIAGWLAPGCNKRELTQWMFCLLHMEVNYSVMMTAICYKTC